MKQTQYDVFISYSWDDVDIAQKIYDAIVFSGLRCCFDRETYHGGADFPEITATNICNSNVFLFLGSKSSFTSGWAPDEVAFAKRHKPRGKLLYYAIDNNTMPEWIDLAFAAINRRNIFEHPYKSVLIEDIRKMLGYSDGIAIHRIDDASSGTTDSVLSQFNALTNNLYSQAIKYLDSINQGENVDNDLFMEIQGLVKKIYSISEICRVNDKRLYKQSKSIVDQYDLFIEALRRLFTADREPEEYNSYAAKSSEEFAHFLDVVVKVIDLLQIMKVRNKLTDLAFRYDENSEKSSDATLSIDERRRAFMDSANTIGEIVQLYRDTRLLYPENVRTMLDNKLNQCNENAENGLLRLIVFVQSFNEEISKLLEN